MTQAAETGGRDYGPRGRPCPRCGAPPGVGCELGRPEYDPVHHTERLTARPSRPSRPARTTRQTAATSARAAPAQPTIF